MSVSVRLSHAIKSLPLRLGFLRGRWLHHRRFHPARRPQRGSSAQPQTNRYDYVDLYEVLANLKKVLQWSCLNASEDLMGQPIKSLSNSHRGCTRA